MKKIENLEEISIIRNLKDSQCDKCTVEKILQLYSNGNIKQVLHLLSVQRCKLLCKIHEMQKPLDNLDYLIFKLKKER